ncbi:PLP-dependent aminotransferase family protein [Derxia gummosa]|uniref:PLP-dependent aminotransferase family protein n=1 Tax=Derxia gummosa DSM 723 TaxID=1121388 RepID=A0A8B6XAP5_9BURK|nr:PLP-dependent aminotransferase family protein [Derxia gummosa]
MTDTVARPAPAAVAGLIDRDSRERLSDQLVGRLTEQIEARVLRSGMRLPSIRACADEQGVARATVVEAYDRLVAAGLVESRRGSGFYVSAPGEPAAQASRAGAAPAPVRVDTSWLLRNMLSPSNVRIAAGSGFLPAELLDGESIATALRSVARQPASMLLGQGTAEGYAPLREQLALHLAGQGIGAEPDRILTTAGVTQGLDLAIQTFVAPGDAVLVEDPAWFVLFARLAYAGARIVPVPRLADGPDLAALDRLCVEHKPRLFVMTAVCHNPTGSTLSLARAHELLVLAGRHGLRIIEDDIYGDFASPSGGRAVRLASLDQLRSVIYCGGFSKTLAPNLRVGYVAADADTIAALAERKTLCAIANPELPERVLYKVLTEGRYRKHVERLRGRVDAARETAVRALEKAGLRVPGVPEAGHFIWADAGTETRPLAAEARRDGILLAPGALFNPTQAPSTWLRFNAATSQSSELHRWLARALDRAG